MLCPTANAEPPHGVRYGDMRNDYAGSMPNTTSGLCTNSVRETSLAHAPSLTRDASGVERRAHSLQVDVHRICAAEIALENAAGRGITRERYRRLAPPGDSVPPIGSLSCPFEGVLT